MKPTRLFTLAALAPTALAALVGCGDVEVAAESEVPTPLVDPLPVTVGIHYSEDFSKYSHSEERWGVDWKADLGPYHVRMAERLFQAAFRETIPVTDLKAIPANPPYVAIIEPRIEQYSFITPKDTGANYYAVTIKYRLNVLAPSGETADSLTFTGYGSFKSGGVSTTAPMVNATKAAMRDAAAKFLVQFPEQDIARKLVAGTPLIVVEVVAPAQVAGAAPVSADGVVVETVPIIDVAPPAEPSAAGQTETGPPSAPAEGNGGSEPVPESLPPATQTPEIPAPTESGKPEPQTGEPPPQTEPESQTAEPSPPTGPGE